MFDTSNNIDKLKIFSSLSAAQLDEYKKTAINNKVASLTEQRKNTKVYLKDRYNNNLENEDLQNKLFRKNNNLDNIYDKTLNKNQATLSDLDTTYLDTRRQIQINEYEYSKRKSSVFMLCIMFFSLVTCILVGIIGSTGIMTTDIKRTAISAILFIFMIYLIVHSIRNSNRSKYDWDMYNWGGNDSDTGSNTNNPFVAATGYNNSSILCSRHPNMCKINNILQDTTLNTKSKAYEVNKIYDGMEKTRNKDYCELQEIESYYKEIQKQRNRLYNKRKTEVEEEIARKREKLKKELDNFDKNKPDTDVVPLDQLKCSNINDSS